MVTGRLLGQLREQQGRMGRILQPAVAWKGQSLDTGSIQRGG